MVAALTRNLGVLHLQLVLETPHGVGLLVEPVHGFLNTAFVFIKRH